MKHGYGTETKTDEYVYSGDFFNDKKHGRGQKLYDDHSEYFGDWFDDKI